MKAISFNTLAEFKRACVKGNYIKGGYYGKHSDEWREIKGVQSNGVSLKTDNNTGRSFFDYPKARDCEIEQGESGSVLKIFVERVKVGNNTDTFASDTWLKWEIERGNIKESECEYYRKQVAEYQVGVENE